MDEIGELAKKIIQCAIAVHGRLGPNLLEPAYKAAFSVELEAVGLKYQRQPIIPALHQEKALKRYRPDFVVEGAVLVEIRQVEQEDPQLEAQASAYLRAAGLKLGLLIDFKARVLKEGITRLTP